MSHESLKAQGLLQRPAWILVGGPLHVLFEVKIAHLWSRRGNYVSLSAVNGLIECFFNRRGPTSPNLLCGANMELKFGWLLVERTVDVFRHRQLVTCNHADVPAARFSNIDA